MTYTPRTRAHEVCRGVGAVLIFAGLLAGFPVVLYTVAGSPIPDGIPTWNQLTAALMQPDTDHRLFLAAVRLLGWAAWAVFVAATCAEAVSYLAGRSAPSLPRPVRPLQVLVRDLVATATLTFSAAATLATPASAGVHATADSPSPASEHPAPQHSPTAADDTEWEPLLSDEPAASPEPEDRTWRTRVIHRGDTLWSLARRAYGSGDHYPKIFKASRDLDQPDGVPALNDPDNLHPGQRIRLPKPRKTPPAPSPARRAPSADRHQPSPTENDHDSGARPSTRPRPPTNTTRPSRVRSPIVAPPADQSPPADQTTGPASSTLTTTDEDPSSSSITLPSGSRIGLGLAGALSIAVAATRLHRRRQRPADKEASQNSAPNEPPSPAPVAKARKAHLDTTYTDHGAPIPSDADLVTHNRPTTPPTELTIGTRDGRPVTLPLFGLSLGLSGHGASGAARAIVTEFLAAAHRDRTELLIPSSDAQALFPHTDFTDRAVLPPGLTVVPTLNAAITQLEAEIVRRARLLEESDQPELAALRDIDPTDPLPTLLLAAAVSDQTTHALDTVLALGRRYGIGGLILSPWQIGTSLHLADDTTVTNAEGPHADALAGAHLFHLTADDATGMLHTLGTAAGAPTTAEVPPSPRADVSPANDPRANPAAAPVLAPPPRASGEDCPRAVRLQLLGPVRIHTPDGPITTGVRRSARDLLTYLGLHSGGITRDQAAGALWPDHEPDAATNAFNTAIANIRKVLRTATGLREPMFVIHTTGRYRLDPALIDIDLWRLTTALTDARGATTDSDRITALAPVADLYTADFATDLTYEWAETHREYLRRTVIDALTRQAQLLEPDHPEQALTILERAITHDPYAEQLYRSVMQLQAQLGNPDAAKRTYRLLTSRLDDLDAEPGEQTHDVLANLQRPHNA